MSPEDYFDGVSSLITRKVDTFNTGVDSFEVGIYRRIVGVLKDLELNLDGTIKTSQINLRLLRRLRGDIEGIVINRTYIAKLDTFLGGFDQLKNINDRYLKTIASTQIPSKQLYKTLTNVSIEITKNSLLESGINQNLIDPIEKILIQNVSTGGNYNDLLESLKLDIMGSPERLGRFQRYTKQITTDSLNQFNANYNEVVSGDIGLEFYLYAGAIKTTTRSYCRTRAGKYYHVKEIKKEIPASWSGKIPDTNANNILIYRGGFNCGHLYTAVSALLVPENVKVRAEAKGYYKSI